LEKPIRKAISDIHVDIMVQQLGTIDQILRSTFSGNNFMIITLSAFALAGLLIALIGLYGVMMQLTVQRHREIGVRLALGADQRAIVKLILSQGGRLIVGGLVVGLGGVFAVNHLYRMTMPELPLPGAPWQLGLALALAFVGLLACYLPARRASRVDPAIVLRAE
jgi:ABC-type antimicrobial peptide transport system permease subunit